MAMLFMEIGVSQKEQIETKWEIVENEIFSDHGILLANLKFNRPFIVILFGGGIASYMPSSLLLPLSLSSHPEHGVGNL